MLPARLRGLIRSTPLRLALFLVILFSAVSLASFGASYLILRNSIDTAIRADLEQQMAGYQAAPSANALAALIASQGAVTDPQRKILTYLAPNGQVFGNVELRRGPQGFLIVDLGPDVIEGGNSYQALAGDFFGGQLIIAQSRKQISELGDMFLTVLLLSLLPTFALALGGGLYLASRSKRRVERITATLARLTSGDLAARVAGPEDGDDLSLIGARIDRMAARQEAATEALRQVSADIAHDLKTPIQRVAVLLDQLGAAPGLPEAAADLAGRARDEAERIVATFQSLLQIAQIEGGSPRAGFAPVDLAEVVRTFVELYAPSAEDAGQSLSLDGPLPAGAAVLGDRGLLGQVVANLIENAMRHCPAGTRIRVGLTAGARVVLTVADDGPGIPEEERGHVLRRLYRLERSRTTPGSGLGLALVDAIATLHGATLTLADAGPGLAVRLDFPAAPGTL